MKEHERIAINNTKAHLSSLKGELAVVNESLSLALQEKEEVQKCLQAVKTDILTAHEYLTSLLEKAKEHTFREKNIARRELALSNERDDFELKKGIELIAIAKRKRGLEDDIATKQNAVAQIEEQLDRATGLLLEQKKRFESLSNKIAALNKELNIAREETAHARAEHAKTVKELSLEIAAKEAQLSYLEEKVEDERQKIRLPMENLKKREEEVKRKELNLTILKARFEQRWQKLYPSQKVNIN